MAKLISSRPADNWDDLRVKSPDDYNVACFDKTPTTGKFAGLPQHWCDTTVTDLFAKPFIRTVDGAQSAELTQRCHEKAILASTDSLWGVSYLASCTYMQDVAKVAIVAEGACDKMQSGMDGLFFSPVFGALVYFIILLVAYIGIHGWDAPNNAESLSAVTVKTNDFELDMDVGGDDTGGKVPGVGEGFEASAEVVDEAAETEKDFEDVA
jgi:hypothetical protein